MEWLKKIAVLGIFAGLLSLAFTCREGNRNMQEEKTNIAEKEGAGFSAMEEVASAADSTSAFSKASEGTRQVLIQHCGRCHQSTLATHKAGAIAIFDLDRMDQWHYNLTEETLEGLARRTSNNSSVTDEERAFIEEFVALKQEQLQ
jgi:hypothetical protein